ncbi:MAG: HlyD family efflux transporter periplasmic adaptor subunit [Rubripirellula sp.]
MSRSTFALRSDLAFRRVWMGDRPMWVIKDPLSRSLTYFSEQEFAILQMADGARTMTELLAACREAFAPKFFSPESLVQFFADAASKGLVVVDGKSVVVEPPGRWGKVNPLAIRLPGVHPDRFLGKMSGWVKPLFSPASMLIASLLIGVALMAVVVNFTKFSDDLAEAATGMGIGRGLMVLFLVVCCTKCVHELSHAFCCKFFGGECRELGVMLLVGIPCLYCDVSDAWLFERRWKRILVSAAGMMSELVIAALATFVWLLSADGLLRDVSVTVMLVCSVNTLLFNGNPLLRYDGYYILSDLVGIPNLASESSGKIREWMRRRLWRDEAPSSVAANADDKKFGRSAFLVGYSICSTLYRVMVYSFILMMLYEVAKQYGLGGFVGTLVLFALFAVAFRWLAALLRPPQGVASRRAHRPVWLMVCCFAFVGVVSLIPIPRSVWAPMSIRAAGAQPVFVSIAGQIGDAVESGADVQRGQVIARLRSFEVESELAAIRFECDRLKVQLEDLRQLRAGDREIAKRIPAIEKALDEAIKRKELREHQAERLVLRAPCEGRLFAPPLAKKPISGGREAEFWSGVPLENANRGAWLQEGTLVGSVGDPTAREAMLFLHQQQIELVEPNQVVTLRLADRRKGSITGRVLNVDASPAQKMPVELTATGAIAADPLQERPLYQVRVILEPTPVPLPIRLVGKAEIEVRKASLWERLQRFLGDSFG